jgi:hypothetical protein
VSFRLGDLGVADQVVVDVGHGVLPQLCLGHPRTEVARHRTHVTVQQLVPRLGERLGELVGVLVEPLGDGSVRGVHAQREVGRQHHRRVPFRRVVGVGHGVLSLGILRGPLLGTGRARRELVVVGVEVLEEPVVPLRRLVGPRSLEPAGERVGTLARTGAVDPAEALVLHGAALGLRAEVVGADRAVGLADGVTTDDERHGLFVVHRHAAERLADVAGRRERVGVAVGAFGVDVDEAHLNGAQLAVELAIAGVAGIAEPFVLGAPEDLLGLPFVFAAEREPERLEPH